MDESLEFLYWFLAFIGMLAMAIGVSVRIEKKARRERYRSTKRPRKRSVEKTFAVPDMASADHPLLRK